MYFQTKGIFEELKFRAFVFFFSVTKNVELLFLPDEVFNWRKSISMEWFSRSAAERERERGIDTKSDKKGYRKRAELN